MAALNPSVVTSDHSFLSDLCALTKPRITMMAVLVSAAGMLNASSDISWPSALFSLAAIAALVSGAGALNMYVERDLDKKMQRTKDRPLPAQRLNPQWAILVGVGLSLTATCLFSAHSNSKTLALGLFSLLAYVFCYTPLKSKTWFSLIVGSVPGAMPVVLGYVAIADQLDTKALSLFLWAFLWQVPHFLAISLFREAEYSSAGFPVFSKVYGERPAKIVLLLSSWLLVSSTLMMFWAGVVSYAYLVICLFFGILFLWACHRGAFSHDTHDWAKTSFKASLAYQSVLFSALIVNAYF